MANFIWGSGGEMLTPESAARKRKVAEALLARSESPAQNVPEGLADIGATLSGIFLNKQADEAERAGRGRAGELYANLATNTDPNAIIAALTNPDSAWASPSQTSIASALLSSGLERSDPAYQLDMQMKQAQLAQLQGGGQDSQTYFGNPIPVQGPNGIQYGQLGNQGGFNIPELPEGYQFLSPVQQLNTGTEFTGVDKFGNATGVTAPINNTGASQDTTVGKGMGEQALQTIEAGRTAAANNAKLGVIETLLTTAPQGGQGKLVQLAGGLGIPLEGLSEIQAAQAVINQMVPLQRAPGSGTMSDADLELYKASLPSIINQPEANQLVISTQRALNDYAIKHADIEQRRVSKQITDEQALAEKAAIPNPLEDFKRALGGEGGSGGSTKPQPAGQVIDWSEL